MERYKLDISFTNKTHLLRIDICDRHYGINNYIYTYKLPNVNNDIFNAKREILYQCLKKNKELDVDLLSYDIKNWLKKCLNT